MKTISIIALCYNKEGNVRELYLRVRAAVSAGGNYSYEHIFIDNSSIDNTFSSCRSKGCFMGIIGEYIGTIDTLVQKRPLVVEQERSNFEYGPGKALQDNEAQLSAAS